MSKNNFLKRFLLIVSTSFILLSGYFAYQNYKFNDGKLHMVICNVGQGDAIFIRTPKGKDILVDAGPDNSVLFCLSNHMPFWDRDLEAVILTHPHKDHYAGLGSVIKRYSVLAFYSENWDQNTPKDQEFLEFKKEIEKRKIKEKDLWEGNKLVLKEGLSLATILPAKKFEAKTNERSLVEEISFGSFRALLTGDSPLGLLDNSLLGQVGVIDVLKVPHHGSKTGLDENVLKSLSPKISVISVGLKNRYHHPAQETLEVLEDLGTRILRTDIDGEVEIVSDGKNFIVKGN